MNEREEEIGKILEPHQLSPGLMRHACIAAVGYLTGISIQSKDQMIATLREAVTTPCAGWETFQSLREELAALRQQLAEKDKQLVEANDERDHYKASTERWLTISKKLFELKRKYGKQATAKAEQLAAQAAELERLQSSSTFYEGLANDYQDVIARLDAEIDRLRERGEADKKLLDSAVHFKFKHHDKFGMHLTDICRVNYETPLPWSIGSNNPTLMGYRQLGFHATLRSAIEACVAQGVIDAGWLPDSNNKES